MNKTLKNILPLILICLFAGVFFSSLFYPKLSLFVTPDFGESDIFELNLPAKHTLFQSLKANELPLWNKNIGTGFPQLAEGQIGTFNIFNLILFKFLPFPLSFNIGYIIIFLTTAIGTYFYCKKIELSIPVSLLSSLTFAFSGFFVAHISHFNLIQTSSFLPWIFLIARTILTQGNQILVTAQSSKTRYSSNEVRSSRLRLPCRQAGSNNKSCVGKYVILQILILALLISQQVFSGFPQITFITLLFLALYIAGTLILQKKNSHVIIFFVISVIISILLSVIQLAPSAEFLSLSNRKAGFPVNLSAYFSYPPKHLITMISPFVLGNPQKGTYPDFKITNGSIFWENTGYIGLFPLLMAVFSLCKIKKNKTALLYWLMLLTSFLLMTGKYSPLYFLYSFPPFSFFRAPSRFILIFIWSLVILSGLGLQNIINFLKKKNFSWLSYFIFLLSAVSFINLFLFGYNYNPYGNAQEWLAKNQTAEFLAGKGHRYVTLNSDVPWNKVFLTQGWFKTAKPYLYLNNALLPNYNTFFNLSSYQTYPILVTKRYQIVSTLLENSLDKSQKGWSISAFSHKLFRLNNIAYIISPDNYTGLKKIYQTKSTNNLSPFKIFEIPGVLPRARMVYKAKVINTIESLGYLLNRDDFDPKEEVILEKNVRLTDVLQNSKTKSVSHVSWLKDFDQEIVLQVKTSKPGLLVLADSYYPGWKAAIDGKETEIFAANLNQRAVKVGVGEHLVTFSYQPSSFKIGAMISAISYLIVLILLIKPFLSRHSGLSRI